MMIKHDLRKNPGQWRPGNIHVVRRRRGRRSTRDRRARTCRPLIAEMLRRAPPRREPGARQGRDGASESDPDPSVQRRQRPYGAMPADAGPRARSCPGAGLLEHRGVPRPQHAGLLRRARRRSAAGSWHPDRDARPWIRFCLRAHFLQIRTMQRRRAEIEELWNGCVALAEGSGLPERCAAALVDTAYGLRIRRGSYQSRRSWRWQERRSATRPHHAT